MIKGWDADPSAIVAGDAVIGEGTRIWGGAHISSAAVIGRNCIIGRGVSVGPGVQIGNRCKIQNGAQIYAPSVLGDGVFVGPSVVLTNDNNPRAIEPDGSLKTSRDWKPDVVTLGIGCSIGAGTVCVAPVRIGQWAMVGAGSVVTTNVKDFSLVVGSPARHIGWVGRAGLRLESRGNFFRCPKTEEMYRLKDEVMELVEKQLQ